MIDPLNLHLKMCLKHFLNFGNRIKIKQLIFLVLTVEGFLSEALKVENNILKPCTVSICIKFCVPSSLRFIPFYMTRKLLRHKNSVIYELVDLKRRKTMIERRREII